MNLYNFILSFKLEKHFRFKTFFNNFFMKHTQTLNKVFVTKLKIIFNLEYFKDFEGLF